MSDKERIDNLSVALKRAIGALNKVRSFVTDEGIKSYTLLNQLDRVVVENASLAGGGNWAVNHQ